MPSNQGRCLTTITGVIIPADWDRDGNIPGVAISTHDEDEYLIQKQAKGSEMLRLIRKEVEITGSTELDQGKKTIAVENHKLRKRHRT
ncbi:MAG: hypothetical protein HY770_06705 [Chitinivibrionia bacterium]|nr:hypothetical protein [Chitinivibrionia bacterium]